MEGAPRNHYYRLSTKLTQDLVACIFPSRVPDEHLQQLTQDPSQKTRPQKPLLIMPRICIVGAGVSGLRCADVLLRNGFEVTILEARERIGGRACQATLSSNDVVDLGPNWIHGTELKAMFDLAKENDASLHSYDSRSKIFGEDGQILEDGTMLSELMWKIIDEAFRYSREHTSTIHPERSLLEFFEEKVIEHIPSGSDRELQRRIIMQMSEFWGGFVGSHIKTQSLKFFWLEECVNGENLFCASTFRKIIDYIAKPAMQANVIKLSTEVISLKSNCTTITVTTKAGADDFDEVVMTAPLGWLQKHKGVFAPTLPDRFLSAIDAISYGCLEKVFITFPRAFWLDDSKAPSEQPFAGFTQWISPAYAPDTNPSRWNQECIELSTLPEPYDHPTLLFYIYGEQAISLSTALGNISSQAEREVHITKTFKPYFSLLPHYARDSKDCAPVSCLMTNWLTDEFAGFGSYTTFRTGLKEGDTDIKIMREGLPGRSLWFAGEHVAPFAAMGTVNGAYVSGESVGKRIAAAYGVRWRTKSPQSFNCL